MADSAKRLLNASQASQASQALPSFERRPIETGRSRIERCERGDQKPDVSAESRPTALSTPGLARTPEKLSLRPRDASVAVRLRGLSRQYVEQRASIDLRAFTPQEQAGDVIETISQPAHALNEFETT